jgi:DNA-binding PadR family transcriptional regulator
MNMHRREFNGFGPWEDMHRGSFRASRGMIEPAILAVLLSKPMHGYEIISTLEENTHGMWRPSAGSIYPTLQLLEEKGLLSAQVMDGKKVYTLTAEGKRAAKEEREEPKFDWKDRTDMLKSFRMIGHDMSEVRTMMHSIFRKGTPVQKQQLLHEIQAFKQGVKNVMHNEDGE